MSTPIEHRPTHPNRATRPAGPPSNAPDHAHPEPAGPDGAPGTIRTDFTPTHPALHGPARPPTAEDTAPMEAIPAPLAVDHPAVPTPDEQPSPHPRPGQLGRHRRPDPEPPDEPHDAEGAPATTDPLSLNRLRAMPPAAIAQAARRHLRPPNFWSEGLPPLSDVWRRATQGAHLPADVRLRAIARFIMGVLLVPIILLYFVIWLLVAPSRAIFAGVVGLVLYNAVVHDLLLL